MEEVMKRVKRKGSAEVTGATWASIVEGDKVQLKYRGYAHVPKWLSGNWATVLRWNAAGNLVVQADAESEGYTRTVQMGDTTNHISEGRR